MQEPPLTRGLLRVRALPSPCMGDLPRLAADAAVDDVVDAVDREGCAVERFISASKVARLQELLDDIIFPPFLGYVDGRHPRRALGLR